MEGSAVMLIEFIKGFLLGTVVSGLNNFLAIRAVQDVKASGRRNAKAKAKIGIVVFLRYMLYFFILYLVHKNSYMLIGTGIGLAAVTHVLVFLYVFKYRKKGVK